MELLGQQRKFYTMSIVLAILEEFLLKYTKGRTMSANGQLVTVHSARYMEAQVMKGHLESEGIPVLLSYESAGLVYGLTIDGIGEVKIMVPERLAEEAKRILGVGEFAKGGEGGEKS
jgi:hypothetical protein